MPTIVQSVWRLGYELDYNRGRDILLRHHVYTSSGAHPASYPMSTEGSFPRVKRPELFTRFHLVQSLRMRPAIHPLPRSLRGMGLN
jgi:hypothetical protein